MDPKLGLQTRPMDGVSARASVYLRAMSDNPWALGDDEDEVAMDVLKAHVPKLLLAQLKSIAAIETAAKKKRRGDKAKVTSLSKLVAEVGSRFVLGYCKEYGLDPKSLPEAPEKRGEEPSEELVRVGHAVAAQQEREERKRK